MLIGILSDVHSNQRHLNKAIDYFNEKKIGLLLHCGDWDRPFTLFAYSLCNCPVKGVMGNGDAEIENFQYHINKRFKDLDIEISARFLDLKIDNKRIAVFHGDDDNLIKTIKDSQMFDLFCIGHTHQAKIEKAGKTCVVNPGSLVGVFLPKEKEAAVTVALYDTESEEAEIVDLGV